MRDIQKVLVIGATGMLGNPVTRALVREGYSVRALVRGRRALLPDAVEQVEGDLFDSTALARAFAGRDAVYLNLAIQPSQTEHDRLAEREGLAAILAAARLAQVARVVSISPLVKAYQGTHGFDWWVFRVKQAAEAAIMASGLPYTMFRASSFFENLEAGMRRGDNISVAGDALYPQWYLSAREYGQMVAEALRRPGSAGRVYVAQGPEALTPRELAERYVAARRPTPLKVQRVPLGMLTFVGTFSRPVRFAAKLLSAMNRYHERFEAQTTWAELGPATTTVETYARARAATVAR